MMKTSDTKVLRTMQIGCLFLFSFLAIGIIPVQAQIRASREQYDTARKTDNLDTLLAFPEKNFHKINGLFLSPQNEEIALKVEKLERRLDEVSRIEDKTALHLLLVQAYKSMHLHAKLPVRDTVENKALPPQVLKSILEDEGTDDYQDRVLALLPKLIADYGELTKLNSSAKTLRSLARTINSILSHSEIQRLTPEVRNIVIKSYILSSDNPLRRFPPMQVGTIYNRLGLKDELISLCREDILGEKQSASKIDDLIWKMQVLKDAGLAKNAIGVADALLLFPAEQVKNNLEEIVEVYASFRPEEALVKFQGLSEKNPRIRIKLYKASCSVNQFGEPYKRHDYWLKPCIKQLKEEKEVNGSNGLILTSFYALAHELECAKDFLGALYVANAVLLMEEYAEERNYWNIALMAGRCYRALGEKDKANEIYKKCLNYENLDADILKSLQRILNHNTPE